jgi:hypothetical protein
MKQKLFKKEISKLETTEETKSIAIGLIDDFLDEMDEESMNG